MCTPDTVSGPAYEEYQYETGQKVRPPQPKAFVAPQPVYAAKQKEATMTYLAGVEGGRRRVGKNPFTVNRNGDVQGISGLNVPG